MQTILQPTSSLTFVNTASKTSLFNRFITWCEDQQQYCFGWLGAIIAFHGCLLTPVTLFAIVLAGSNIWIFSAAIISMGIALVTNLSAMPTKITIPAFFVSVLIDIVLIIISASMGFSLAASNL